MEDSKDLSISGPGSPVSLNKFFESEHYDPNKSLTVLVDGSGYGIAKDAPETVYITAEECKTQSLYYGKTLFNGRQIPAYLFRYLSYLFFDKDYESDAKMIEELEIEATKKHLELENESGKIEGLDEYKTLLNMLKNIEHNAELQQCVGLIQLISGTLSVAKKHGKRVRMYLEKPETNLHPKRQYKIVTLLENLKKDYE